MWKFGTRNKLQKTPLCVTFVAKCNFWEWEWTLLASFAFGKPCLFDLVWAELMCQLWFMRFSFHTRWVHIDYWNRLLLQFFLHFWFLIFDIFFQGTKSTNLWVIQFNFRLKKKGLHSLNGFELSCWRNTPQDKASTRHKKNLHSHVSILHMRLLKKLRLKKCIDFHSNFNCLSKQP